MTTGWDQSLLSAFSPKWSLFAGGVVVREAELQVGPQVRELPHPLSPGNSRRPRNVRSCGKAWRSYGYAGYRGPRGPKRPRSSGLHPRWPPVEVRAKDPQKGRS